MHRVIITHTCTHCIHLRHSRICEWMWSPIEPSTEHINYEHDSIEPINPYRIFIRCSSHTTITVIRKFSRCESIYLEIDQRIENQKWKIKLVNAKIMSAQFNQMFALVALVTCKWDEFLFESILKCSVFFRFERNLSDNMLKKKYFFVIFVRFCNNCIGPRIIVWQLRWWMFRCMRNEIFSVCANCFYFQIEGIFAQFSFWIFFLFIIRTCCFNYLRKRSSSPPLQLRPPVLFDENGIWMNKAEFEQMIHHPNEFNGKSSKKDEYPKSAGIASGSGAPVASNNHDQLNVIYDV